MQKKSPLQLVRDQFGSKEELVNKLLPLIDRLKKEESDSDFARRIGNASNTQLLRMWKVEQAVQERFGSKDALIDAIVRLKFKEGKNGYKGNADYQAALGRKSKSYLLDLHRQLKG